MPGSTTPCWREHRLPALIAPYPEHMLRPGAPACRAVVIGVLVLAPGAADAAASSSPPKAQYTADPGPARAHPTFSVAYSGSGSYRTVFHATPPNPGGKPDTNDAHDTSKQSWDVKFRRKLAVPTCGQPAGFGDDPCGSLGGLSGASGKASMIGKVDHKHVDGPYKQLNRTVR